VAQGHTDYSGTPSWRKLGIKEGARVRLEGAPDGFGADLGAMSPLPPAVELLRRATKDLDVVVLFATERRALELRFAPLAHALRPNGRLWIAWPKKASHVATDLDFSVVQAHGLAHGLVDNKTASITDVYQGCQFVFRLQDRPTDPARA
jgi:hypothetical protein